MTAILIKILSIILITAGFIMAVRVKSGEYAFLLSLACGAVVLFMAFDMVMPYVSRLKAVFTKASGAAPYFIMPLKVLGLAYITDFIADTCRDFGLAGLAAKAEFAGKCAIFILCVPPAISILEVALKFAGL